MRNGDDSGEGDDNMLPFSPKERRILSAVDQLQRGPAHQEDEVTYWPRGLIGCTLPHSNPGDVLAYSRNSGDYYLLIQPGLYNDRKQGIKSFGFPYGSYPRLVCSFLAREVKRHRARTVSLGQTLSAFMRELGLVPTGGRWGTIPNLRRQVLALVNARIAFGYSGELPIDAGGNQIFADRYALWWDHVADQGTLFPNYVELSEPLFEELLEHAVPCDIRILKALKQSSLALDLYIWATYRVFRLNSATAISWKALHSQFGSEYAAVKDFRRKALKHLKTINVLYPEFKYTLERGRIVVWPSKTSVLPMPRKRRG